MRMKQNLLSTVAETLLEVVVAVGVLMIVLGPASATFVASVRTVGQNRNDLVAASLAEEGVEVEVASGIHDVSALLEAGLPVGDVVLARTRPEEIDRFSAVQ